MFTKICYNILDRMKGGVCMKKKTWVTTTIIFLLIVVCLSLWQYHTFKNEKLEVMCKGSVNAAWEHFKEYEIHKEESDYIAGVAEFRTYMTAYLCLNGGESNTNYIWCNTLYGDMILNPEKVKAHISKLLAALDYLAEDYEHPNGFHLINTLNNQLRME